MDWDNLLYQKPKSERAELDVNQLWKDLTTIKLFTKTKNVNICAFKIAKNFHQFYNVYFVSFR